MPFSVNLDSMIDEEEFFQMFIAAMEKYTIDQQNEAEDETREDILYTNLQNMKNEIRRIGIVFKIDKKHIKDVEKTLLAIKKEYVDKPREKRIEKEIFGISQK